MSTYIGASTDCVQALVADDQLEVLAASPDQHITADADTINPGPSRP